MRRILQSAQIERTRLNRKGGVNEPPPVMKEICSNFQADSTHRRHCGACERFSDSQLISSLILLVTGGVVSGVSTSKRERVERGGGQQKYLVSRHPYYYYYYYYYI